MKSKKMIAAMWLLTFISAGLVQDDKRGKFIYYDLNLSVLDEITGWIAALKGDGHEK